MILPDEQATRDIGAQLARVARSGDVITLSGPLGVGKTAVARGFIEALGHSKEVPSPSFALVQPYERLDPPVWHFDLYRLDSPEDAYELGIEDAFAEGIALIEWPERLGRLMTREHLGVALAPGADETSRVATLTPSPSWAGRIAGLKHG